MYFVSKIINDKIGITDTNDGVEEFLDRKTIGRLVKQGVKIKGVERDGKIHIFDKQELRRGMDYLLRKLCSQYPCCDVEKDYETGNFSIRHWGEWVVPEDYRNDDDFDQDELEEEDFDWKELSEESEALFRSICKDLEYYYPNLTCKILEIGEKNWIYAKIKYK